LVGCGFQRSREGASVDWVAVEADRQVTDRGRNREAVFEASGVVSKSA
jgi:hypothetical protein